MLEKEIEEIFNNLRNNSHEYNVGQILGVIETEAASREKLAWDIGYAAGREDGEAIYAFEGLDDDAWDDVDKEV